MPSLNLQLHLIATQHQNLELWVEDLGNSDGKSALECYEHVPREAIPQLCVQRAASPSSHTALCHCHSSSGL